LNPIINDHNLDIEQTHIESLKVNINPGEEIERDDNFSYEGFQVVRGEFFAHLREPSITFNKQRVSLNTACLNRLPDVDYVKILVNPTELKLVVQPSSENERDSFIWRSQSAKRKPKQVICRVFYGKIMELMNWNTDYRYKLLGKLIQSNNEYLFAFDLTSPEVFQSTVNENGQMKSSRTPLFPAEWKNQFGLPVEEHRKRLQVDIFKGYTVFNLKEHKIPDRVNEADNLNNQEENNDGE